MKINFAQAQIASFSAINPTTAMDFLHSRAVDDRENGFEDYDRAPDLSSNMLTHLLLTLTLIIDSNCGSTAIISMTV